jgi:dTDP-4-amino-4,6-dideoxygalactose transaminase
MGPGINGKMNEIQAAMGLLQLQHIDAALQNAKRSTEYVQLLMNGCRNFAYNPQLTD